MKKQDINWILFWVLIATCVYLVHHYGKIK